MDINLFKLEPEKVYGLKANEDRKEEKINQCVISDNYVASLKKDGQYHRYVNYEAIPIPRMPMSFSIMSEV